MISPPLRVYSDYDEIDLRSNPNLRDNAIVAKLKLTQVETAILRAVCDPLYPHLEDTVLDNQGQEKAS